MHIDRHATRRLALVLVLPLAAAGLPAAARGESLAAAAATPVAHGADVETVAGSSRSPTVPITKAEVHAYRITMPKLRAWYKAQETATRRWEPGDDIVRDEDSDDDDPNVLYRHILSHPRLEAIARDAGLSAREFTVLTFAMVDAAMEARALELDPKAKTESLPANIAVMRANEAELSRLRTRLAALEREKRARKAKLESSDDEPGA